MESAKQKYIENRRSLLQEPHVNDEMCPQKKPKLTIKPKVNRKLKPKDDQTLPNIDFKGDTCNTNFMDMNNDCIRVIFKYLNASDLCSLSTQCQRLQMLTKDQLFRHFPEQAEKIKCFEENDYWYHYPGTNQFITCFAEFKKLSIDNSMKNFHSFENLYEYLQAKEFSRIDEMYFAGCRNLRPTHGRAMAKMTENTKSVTFNRTKIIGEFYQSILCHFPSIENLILQNTLDMVCESGQQINWLKEIYPNLKSFSWFLDKEIDVINELKLFFEQNKTIEHFALYTCQIETLQKLEEANIEITHLYFRITDGVEEKLMYLKKMCHKYESLRLHLMFDDKCRTQLTSHIKLFKELKMKLDGLYLDGLPPSVSLVRVIAECVHLKDLQVRHCKYIDDFADLPNLENVYVARGMTSATYDQIYQMIFKFATRAPKLKNLFFRNSYRSFFYFNFKSINNMRSQLEGATKMTFHVRTKAKERFAELSQMNLSYDMFNIKTTEVESLQNPLANDWLYAH